MKKDVLCIVGERIRSIREERGYTQESLAEYGGLHRTYIGMVERGERNITLLNIIKIASALNIELVILLKDL